MTLCQPEQRCEAMWRAGFSAIAGLLRPRATAELSSAWTAEGGRPYASGYSNRESASARH
jgi:hypothetical protein